MSVMRSKAGGRRHSQCEEGEVNQYHWVPLLGKAEKYPQRGKGNREGGGRRMHHTGKQPEKQWQLKASRKSHRLMG